MEPRPIELLAPARDAAIAIEAIKHGADAVYMGGPSHGARSAATNSVDDIARVADYAHRFNVRVYVTLNTLIYEDELRQVEAVVSQLYDAGVDALIVQDMALLEMDIPPIQLHASTQCDIRSAEKARFLQDVGFSQLVLPRELSLEEIRQIRAVTDVPLEAFVHGALCVSYSGDCQAGYAAMGRSANRGECPQICRLKYDLTDCNGNTLVKNKHLLSLRDMNRSTDIYEMLEAGVSSLKIEGRLKDMSYVKNTVAAYRAIIDDIIRDNTDRYCRASSGHCDVSFNPDLSKSFNRGFTSYFLNGVNSVNKMAAVNTPKMVGERVGVVSGGHGKTIKARLNARLHNGDGIGFFNDFDEFDGFRVNRVEGNSLHLANPVAINPGTVLYRNYDKEWSDSLAGETSQRYVNVRMSVKSVGNDRISLTISDERGNCVTKTAEVELSPAKSPQEDARRRVLTKTGDTIYRVDSVDDRLGNLFVPSSVMTRLRRETLCLLDSAQKMRYESLKRAPKLQSVFPYRSLTYHDNVANSSAENFYKKHSVSEIEPALEVKRPTGELRVMSTRYCIRREFCSCLKSENGKQWRGPLYLKILSERRYRLDFDCAKCQMSVIECKKDSE
jgi:putative protease